MSWTARAARRAPHTERPAPKPTRPPAWSLGNADLGTALLRIRARAHAEDVNCPTAADVVTRKIHFTLDTERELR